MFGLWANLGFDSATFQRFLHVILNIFMGDVSHMSCNAFPLSNSRVDQMIQLSSECKYHVLVAWRFIRDIGRQEPGVFMS